MREAKKIGGNKQWVVYLLTIEYIKTNQTKNTNIAMLVLPHQKKKQNSACLKKMNKTGGNKYMNERGTRLNMQGSRWFQYHRCRSICRDARIEAVKIPGQSTIGIPPSPTPLRPFLTPPSGGLKKICCWLDLAAAGCWAGPPRGAFVLGKARKVAEANPGSTEVK